MGERGGIRAGEGMPRRAGGLRIGVGIVGLTLIVVLVCWITLTPSPVDRGHDELVKHLLGFLHSKGVPEWFGYNKLEFSANIAMFAPLGFFVGLLLPLRRVWIGGLAGTSFSMLVEIVQFFVLPERYASVLDVLANTLGGWIGIGLAVLVRLGVAARDRRLIADAIAWHDAVARRDAGAGSRLPERAAVAGAAVEGSVVAGAAVAGSVVAGAPAEGAPLAGAPGAEASVVEAPVGEASAEGAGEGYRPTF